MMHSNKLQSRIAEALTQGTFDLSLLEPGKESTTIAFLVLEYFAQEKSTHYVVPIIAQFLLSESNL